MDDSKTSSLGFDLPDLEADFPDNQAVSAQSDVRSKIWKLIQQLKIDASFAERQLAANISLNADYLVPAARRKDLTPRAKAILGRYALVDTLAIFFRNRTRFTLKFLLSTAFLAMVVFEVFAHILPEFFHIGARPRWTFWLYPLLWLGAWSLWFHTHHQSYQKKYEDYRALAEGLRVQFFWYLLGLQDPVEEYYLLKQQGELDWIRRSLQLWRERDSSRFPETDWNEEQRNSWRRLAHDCWVREQYNYFATIAGPREKRSSSRCKLWAGILFWCSLALSLVLCIRETWFAAHHHQDLLNSVLILLVGLFLAGSAIVIAYGEKMAFSEHARQYAAMSLLFGDVDKKMTNSTLSADDQLSEWKRLGREALQENGDWLLLHRDRPLEVVVP